MLFFLHRDSKNNHTPWRHADSSQPSPTWLLFIAAALLPPTALEFVAQIDK